MSEQFYRFTLQKRRKGRTMKPAQRLDAQAAFLEAYEHSANILRAAEQTEISREIVYYWLEHDEQFLMAYNIADNAANAHIEAEIRRRGIEGVVEPLVSAGRVVYDEVEDEKGRKHKQRIMVRKYSDTLLIFYAKRRMPEYREKSQVDVHTNTQTQDTQALYDAVERILEPYPEAKWKLAEAIAELEKSSKA